MPEESEQAEKRRVLANDISVRCQQGSTFLDHTHIDDAGGRFGVVNEATIIGRDGPLAYPQLPESSPWHSDMVPPEPSLGFRVDAMPKLESPAAEHGVSPAVGPDGPTSVAPSKPASSSLSEHDVGPSLSQEKDDGAE
jgi:hypothetical protein